MSVKPPVRRTRKAAAKKSRALKPKAAARARPRPADAVARVARTHERLVVRAKGKAAAVVPLEDLHRLRRLEEEAEDRWAAAVAEKALAKSKGRPRVPLDDVRKRLGL